MNEEHHAFYKSDVGLIEIVGTEKGLLSLHFAKDRYLRNSKAHPCLRQCLVQLDEYFAGKRKKFSVDLQLHGTEFQKKVWRGLLKISYGKTVSYKYIAEMVGNVKAVRAVGNANRKNNIAIIIPCHRVIGSNGTMVGYAEGIWRKKWLLEHERAISNVTF